MPIATVGKKTILFIQIPKTAGMSVDRFLRDNATVTADNRLSAYAHRVRLRHLHREPLEELYSGGCFDWVFTVVRHPVERLISEYRYQRRHGGLHPQNFMSFGPWLRYWLARARRNTSVRENHFRPQSDFVAFGADVFHLENGLEAVGRKFAEVTGISDPVPIRLINTSPKEPVRLSQADHRLIADFYKADFDTLGYCTNSNAGSVSVTTSH